MAKGERGRAPTVLLPKEKEAVTRSRTQEDDGFECVSFYSFKNKQYIDGSRKKFPNQRFLRNTKQIVSVEKYQQLPPATPTCKNELRTPEIIVAFVFLLLIYVRVFTTSVSVVGGSLVNAMSPLSQLFSYPYSIFP